MVYNDKTLLVHCSLYVSSNILLPTKHAKHEYIEYRIVTVRRVCISVTSITTVKNKFCIVIGPNMVTKTVH